jgi:cytochrome b561
MAEMSAVGHQVSVEKYPLRMQIFHWSMAVLILAMIWAGWTMVSMDEATPAKYETF